MFRNGGRVVTMTTDELLPESFDARTSDELAAVDGSAQLGALPCPMRERFGDMLAVGGGPGCPKEGAREKRLRLGRRADRTSGSRPSSTLSAARRSRSRRPSPTRRGGGSSGSPTAPTTSSRSSTSPASSARSIRSPSGCSRRSTPSFDDVDAVLFVVDARAHIGAGDRFVARRVFGLEKPVVIALNKVDRLKPAHIASQMKMAAALGDFHALHPVSAKTKEGVGELRGDLVSLLPEGPCLLPGRAGDRPRARGARRRGDPREGAPPHPRGGPARGDRRGRGARGEAAASRDLRRDRVAEGHPRREEGRDGARDRHTRAAGGRGSRRSPALPRAPRQGAAEVAAETPGCSRDSGSSPTSLHSAHGQGTCTRRWFRASVRAATPAHRLGRRSRARGARCDARQALDQARVEGAGALSSRSG